MESASRVGWGSARSRADLDRGGVWWVAGRTHLLGSRRGRTLRTSSALSTGAPSNSRNSSSGQHLAMVSSAPSTSCFPPAPRSTARCFSLVRSPSAGTTCLIVTTSLPWRGMQSSTAKVSSVREVLKAFPRRPVLLAPARSSARLVGSNTKRQSPAESRTTSRFNKRC